MVLDGVMAVEGGERSDEMERQRRREKQALVFLMLNKEFSYP